MDPVVVEKVLGVWEQQARGGLIQFIGMLEVTVMLLCVETTYLPVLSYNLILYIKILYSSLHNFFLSLLLLIRCILSLSGFFKQYRIKYLCAIQVVLGSIPGGDQIFLILYCL